MIDDFKNFSELLEKNAFRDQDHFLRDLASYISSVTSNQLGLSQRSMLKSRLRRRYIDLKVEDYKDYINHFKRNFDDETRELTSLLTTHHTFFFREFAHFDFLLDHLDYLVQEKKKSIAQDIEVISLACSQGQEVYSLAMFLDQHLKGKGVGFHIQGLDIDHKSIEVARKGIYSYKEIKEIPALYLQNHWQRGKSEYSDFVRVKDELKAKCQFDEADLKNISSYLKVKKYDIILCRNVFIYFSKEMITEVVKNVLNHMNDHAFFVSGLSEPLDLNSFANELKRVGPCVYQKSDAPSLDGEVIQTLAHNVDKEKFENQMNRSSIQETTPVLKKTYKVLIVDDSPVIRKILHKIFTEDESFTVVGSAADGVEAHEKVSELKPDMITLDIHMPNMTGVEYLEKYAFQNKQHPKVLMVSSVSREDTLLASKAFEFGASDFIEKPALNEIDEKKNEILAKARTILRQPLKSSFTNTLSLIPSKHKEIMIPAKSHFINIIAHQTDSDKILFMLNDFHKSLGPIFIGVVGFSLMQDQFINFYKSKYSKRAIQSCHEDHQKNDDFSNDDTVYFYDPKIFNPLEIQSLKNRVSIVHLIGEHNKKIIDSIRYSYHAVYVEEGCYEKQSWIKDLFPHTSMAHMSLEFIADRLNQLKAG